MPIVQTSLKSKNYNALGIDEIADDITNIITEVNGITADGLPVVADGVTITGDGTALDPLVSVAPTAAYKVYAAKLTQTGTAAPVATILENTLSGAIVWTRDQAGVYTGTLAGAFTVGKTIMNGVTTWSGNAIQMFPISDGGTVVGYLYFDAAGLNEITFRVYDDTFGLAEYSTLIGTTPLYIEVKVYN